MINTQIPAQLAADLSENQIEALAAWAKKHTQQAFILGAQKGFDFGLNMDADGFEAMLAAADPAQTRTSGDAIRSQAW